MSIKSTTGVVLLGKAYYSTECHVWGCCKCCRGWPQQAALANLPGARLGRHELEHFYPWLFQSRMALEQNWPQNQRSVTSFPSKRKGLCDMDACDSRGPGAMAESQKSCHPTGPVSTCLQTARKGYQKHTGENALHKPSTITRSENDYSCYPAMICMETGLCAIFAH